MNAVRGFYERDYDSQLDEISSLLSELKTSSDEHDDQFAQIKDRLEDIVQFLDSIKKMVRRV